MVGVVSEMRDPSWINNYRNVPYPTVVWSTSGTPVVLELTSASISTFFMVPGGIRYEMVAEVDGVWVRWSLDVNEVCGDELCVLSGDDIFVLRTDDISSSGNTEVVWVATSGSP